MAKRGAKGGLPMSINSTRIPEFLLSLYIKLYFLIECPQIKSLNACKRVGVISHIQ